MSGKSPVNRWAVRPMSPHPGYRVPRPMLHRASAGGRGDQRTRGPSLDEVRPARPPSRRRATRESRRAGLPRRAHEVGAFERSMRAKTWAVAALGCGKGQRFLSCPKLSARVSGTLSDCVELREDCAPRADRKGKPHLCSPLPDDPASSHRPTVAPGGPSETAFLGSDRPALGPQSETE
jgi:hypothetical protein